MSGTSRQPEPRRALSAAERRDWEECEQDYAELMQELADREFQLEVGLIDSYQDYTFTWGRPTEEEPEAVQPPRPARNGAEEPPF
ncbi:hypothetical protein ACFWSF_09460 [Streptomyces sp. NPDC058611]|uniref:hypothetical protein n=2 Tax=Streptomyces TaxID=1883 RepID=UPI003647C314